MGESVFPVVITNDPDITEYCDIHGVHVLQNVK